MFTMFAHSTRKVVSALAAVSIVSFSAMALDQGHIAAAPRGSVEIGELQPVNLMQMAAVTLPEVVVSGRRVEGPQGRFALRAELPEVVVVAGRSVTVAARASLGELAAAR